MFATCDFNLCFTLVLVGHTWNMHDAGIFAHSIHSPKIHFSLMIPKKNYLVDFEFAHHPRYMVPYKGLDILYYFQQFHDECMRQHHRFRNAQEKFNFKHSSYWNVIERAFDVWKQRWKILDRMPSYMFPQKLPLLLP